MDSETKLLNFVPVSSFIQSSFWNKLAELKINVDKLSENDRQIWGYYTNVSSTWATHVLEVDSTSFNTDIDCKINTIPFHGKLFNKNTIEQFKNCDKNALINDVGKKFLENLKTGVLLENPSMLNFFFVLSFSDLKKYHFYYWFAFPVPHSLNLVKNKTISLTQIFSDSQLTTLLESYNNFEIFQKPYFLLHNNEICTLSSKLKQITSENVVDFYFAFADCKISEDYPKPQLKNYIILILHYCPFLNGKTVNFLSLSLTKKLTLDESTVFELTLPKFKSNEDVEELIYENGENGWAGWEKNEKNKFAPRLSNMKATMDPQVLYEESVDLNLKLMKWRLLPNIDLGKIKNIKCLLLGAGTLGCSVARTLLGWGVRNMTFVDNSMVSFSNPVRQSLYTYEDYIGSKPKAEAAAESLRKIFPGINSKAFQFTIPMPGHTVGENQVKSVEKNVENLKQLIEEHDIIFLLTDSRESRWLPTLFGIRSKKIIINVALGFDTYLVMRYGIEGQINEETSKVYAGFKKIAGNELGCYFCNDVTAPGNSMKDRTLDQQCTVTRPGISAIAGALAVELAISLIQHEDGAGAPAYYKLGNQEGEFTPDFDDQSILGVLPHSIRGFLSSFTSVLPATPKYNQCIACSKIVLDEFEAKGFEFLLQSFNSSKYLEDLTGLSELLNENNYVDVLEMNDEDWQD